MSLPRALATHTVTLVRSREAYGEDAYGNSIGTVQERIDVSGCSLQPVTTKSTLETLTASSDAVEATWMLYAELDVQVTPQDRIQQARDRVSPVEDDADAYLDLEVSGIPSEWVVTGTSLDHQEIPLKRHQG